MLRRTDGFALLGILLLLAGVLLYLGGSSHRISLIYWLGGPLLWFAGFAVLVGWLSARLLSGARCTSSSSPKGALNTNSNASNIKQKGVR